MFFFGIAGENCLSASPDFPGEHFPVIHCFSCFFFCSFRLHFRGGETVIDLHSLPSDDILFKCVKKQQAVADRSA